VEGRDNYWHAHLEIGPLLPQFRGMQSNNIFVDITILQLRWYGEFHCHEVKGDRQAANQWIQSKFLAQRCGP